MCDDWMHGDYPGAFTAYASSNRVGYMLRLRREGFLHSKRLHDELQCSSTGIQRIKS